MSLSSEEVGMMENMSVVKLEVLMMLRFSASLLYYWDDCSFLLRIIGLYHVHVSYVFMAKTIMSHINCSFKGDEWIN